MELVDNPSLISVARITRPRGNRGEVLAVLHTDFPARFEILRQVWVEVSDRSRKRLTIEKSWIHNGRLVLKFSGIDSISAAEHLSGAWVMVEASQAVNLPEGSYFDHDLIGCKIVDCRGEILGTVEEILRLSGNFQLVVRGRRGEFLVPAVEAICREVSIRDKIIRVDLPEGLMDLNQ